MLASLSKSVFAVFALALLPAQDSYQGAKLALLGQDYTEAIRLLDESLREAGDDAQPKVLDRLRFLRANAQFLAGKRDEAEAGFRSLMQERQDSNYRHLARFGIARCLEDARSFQDAARLYREEVARILSAERRMELAQVYLDLSQQALADGPEKRKAAIEFLDLALALRLPEAERLRLQERAAKLAFEFSDWKGAAKRFQELVESLRGQVLGEGNGKPVHELRLWLARAWQRSGNRGMAQRLLEDLLREGLSPDLAPEARFELALSYGVPNQGALLPRGVDALRNFLAEHDAHEKAPYAAYLLAKSQVNLGRITEALATLEKLTSDYADSGAEQLPLAAADRAELLTRLQRYDDAVAAWRDYLSRYPAHGRWMQAQRAIVDLAFRKADQLRKQGKEHYEEAIRAYSKFLEENPLDGRAAAIHLQIAKMRQEQEKYEEAKLAYQRCADKYPNTNEASEAGYRIGLLLEGKLFDYEQAIAAYQKVRGRYQGAARQRIRILSEESLGLRTERVFETDEKPRVHVTSRNLESLRVRVYKLDLESFHRGTLGSGAIQRLAVEVIEPDATFESKTPGYRKHQETERQIVLPFEGPGAFVVKVDGGELEATSLVLVSDIAVITKVSRKEFFVFAQNTRTSQVASDVTLVVTDGNKILAEGKTDARGVWRYTGEALQDRNHLHVLASSPTGGIATTLGLSGLMRSSGLQPRYFLYSDRTAYRPGDVVHARAVLRDVDSGLYVVPKNKGYSLLLHDASGRMLARESATLTEFGTVHASFALPADGATGNYSIRLYDEQRRTTVANHNVSVQQYSPPRVSLSIDAERSVIVRGEKIEGVVRARYFFGGPVANKRIRVAANIRGPRIFFAETDAAGEYRFSFDSRELWQGATVQVRVDLPEENASTTQAYRVERTGFDLAVSLPSQVYLVGEDLQAKALVKGHDGEKLSRKLVMELSRLEVVDNRITEIPVARHELTSDGKSGEAFGRFELAQGGKHRLRVHAVDRFDQRIDKSMDFFVSGKDDEVKLRILSRVQYGKVGEKVKLRVVNRAGPRLALLTHEASHVLGFETRILPEGESEIEIVLDEKHAPNFAAAIAMMDAKDRKLHSAKKDFKVSQPLSMQVVPGSKRVEPGGKISLEIEARDSRGEPVAGEFALALVDQAEIDLWGEDPRNVYEFFLGSSVQRRTDMRLSSSCTFQYNATTTKVNQAIRAAEKLEERKRREDAAKEKWAGNSSDFEVGRGLRTAARRPAESPSADKKAAKKVLDEIQEMESAKMGLGGGAGGSFGARRGGRQQLALERVESLSKHVAGQRPQLGGVFYADGKDADIRGRTANLFGKQLQVMDSGNAGTEGAGEDVAGSFAAPAVWIPSVRTNESGRARVELETPRRSASWRLRVRGVGKTSQFGEVKSQLVTAKDLVVEAAIPEVLTEGDQARVRVDLHNLGTEKRATEWVLRRGEEELARGQASIGGKGHVERDALLKADNIGSSTLRVDAKSGEVSDAYVQPFEVLPWSIEERVVHSGRLAGRVDVPVRLPEKREYRAHELIIEVGPDTPEDFFPFGGLRESSQLCLNRPHFVPPTIDNRASVGLAALALLSSYGESAPDAKGRIAKLRAQVESTIAALAAAEQNGQFYWLGGVRGRKTISTGSSIVGGYFLVRAEQAGFRVDPGVLSRVRNFLRAQERGRDAEAASFAFLALATDGNGDFARFNTLYRGRSKYDLGTLGRLALAAHAMRRPGLALDLEQRLSQKLEFPEKLEEAESVRSREVADRLWALLALAKAKGHEALLARGERWLQQTRRPWGYTHGLALALGAEFLGLRRTADEKLPGKVTVQVGDFRKVIDFEKDTARRRIFAPAELIASGEVSVRIESSGRGHVVWSVLYRGLTNGLPKQPRDRVTRIRRRYLQAPAVFEGYPLPEGFGCLAGKHDSWRNEASAVALGDSVSVELSWWHAADDRAKYGTIVIEEPLPAGCVVRLQDVEGTFDHVEQGQGFLRFYLHSRHRATSIRYSLRGFLPGKYRVLPTHVYSVENPSLSRYGSSAELVVLGRGEKSPDERRPTPDEQLERGRRLFDALTPEALSEGSERREAAWSALMGLYEEYGKNLRDDAFKQSARRLLRLALARADAKNIVVFFEALKDRDEDYVLSFEDTARVADAYYRTGEFEQALRTCKAIAETAFLKEMQIAGTLDRLGQLRSSVHFVERLSMHYPTLPTMRGTLYALANSLNLKAQELTRTGAAYDPKIGTPLDLRRKARQLCYEYLVRHPDDADADEVIFTLASVALEADQLDEAIELLQRGAKAHPRSKWLDDFLYLEGFAWFEKRERKKALELLQRVATEEFRNEKGRMAPSESRELALFLQGQIHHAAGDPERALALYDQVDERYIEAREASDYFQAKKLKVPEVNLVKPGSASEMKLVVRNIERADVTVYQVDLMRLYLLRKSLSDMGDVQLFGIAPIHRQSVDLSKLGAFRDHEVELSLPMKDAGAYLVLVRAKELKTSGLLLRTDLEIEAQERTEESRLRVNVKREGVFLPQAQVKVVGAQDGKIRSGETDLRGVYVADDLRGRATVLVKDGESYAFYRSRSQFGGATPKPQKRSNKQQQQMKSRDRFDPMGGNSIQNFRLQNEAREQLKQLYFNDQKGVEIRRSK